MVFKTHSKAFLQIVIEHPPGVGAVEQPAAVQLILQVYLGLVIHHPPGRVEKCLLRKKKRCEKNLFTDTNTRQSVSTQRI